jgi:hypothetical protein
MASQTAKGSGSTVNNGATVANGGNVAGVTQSLDLNDINGGIGVSARYGSKIVAKTGAGTGDPTNTTNPDGIQTSKGSGTLAYNRGRDDDGNWIVRAAGTTGAGKINNSTTTRLHIAAADGGKGKLKVPEPVIATRTHGVRAITVTATPSTARHPEMALTGGGAASTFIDPVDGLATTLADIKDTRAIPGELTYMFGGKAPKSDDYKNREVFES